MGLSDIVHNAFFLCIKNKQFYEINSLYLQILMVRSEIIHNAYIGKGDMYVTLWVLCSHPLPGFNGLGYYMFSKNAKILYAMFLCCDGELIQYLLALVIILTNV